MKNIIDEIRVELKKNIDKKTQTTSQHFFALVGVAEVEEELPLQVLFYLQLGIAFFYIGKVIL